MKGKEIVLEGQKFVIGLPTNNKEEEGLDWHDVMYQSNNWFSQVASWTRSVFKKNSNSTSFWTFGGKDWEQKEKGTCELLIGPEVGFRPVLTPVREDGQVDPSVFEGIENGSVIKMYTLLVDGQPIEVKQMPRRLKEDEAFEFTDEFFGERFLIPWVFCGSHAMSTLVVLNDISQTELQEFGYA